MAAFLAAVTGLVYQWVQINPQTPQDTAQLSAE